MAYTNSPQLDTYSTVEFPLVKEFGHRGSTIGPLLVNAFYENVNNELTGESRVDIKKRAGTETVVTASGTNIRGIYYWKDQQKFYVGIDDKIIVYNADTFAVVTTLNTVWATSTGRIGFTEFLYDIGTTKLVVVDGTRLVTIDSANTVATSVDADLPAHIPDPVYIDGYLLLLKTNTADIYNSDLNDPLLWTAGNFITGEMLPDQATRLSKSRNYAVLLGRHSVEFFYDAAIEQGSPFQRNESYVKQIGFSGGLATLGPAILFCGSINDSDLNIFLLKDSTIQPVGNNIRTILSGMTTLTNVTGNVFSFSGYDFYVFNTGSVTLVLDLKTMLWSKWAFQSGSSFTVDYSANTELSTATGAYRPVFTKSGDNKLYRFNDTVFQDNGTNFTVTILTGNEDFGTYNQKNMNRLIFVTDRPTSSLLLSVSWSDDDFATYNTPQTVDLAQENPCLYRQGRFRYRSLSITYTGSSTFRLRKVYAEINKGAH